MAGVPWTRIGEAVGHDDLVTTAPTYTHVVADERELEYEELLQWRSPRKNLDQWNFSGPGADVEADHFLALNYGYALIADMAWREEIVALVKNGIAEPTGEGHVKVAHEQLLRGWRSGESQLTKEGRLRRRVLKAMLREHRWTGQIRFELGVVAGMQAVKRARGEAID